MIAATRTKTLSCVGNARRRLSTRSPTGMDFPAGLNRPKADEPMVNIGRGSAVHPLGTAANSRKSTPSIWFENCDMVVEEGQSWVVVGTSGAGKDLLLQVGAKSYNGQAALTLSLPGAAVVARSHQNPPFPSSARRSFSILDPPSYPARSLQIRLPRLVLTPTKVPNRLL